MKTGVQSVSNRVVFKKHYPVKNHCNLLILLLKYINSVESVVIISKYIHRNYTFKNIRVIKNTHPLFAINLFAHHPVPPVVRFR